MRKFINNGLLIILAIIAILSLLLGGYWVHKYLCSEAYSHLSNVNETVEKHLEANNIDNNIVSHTINNEYNIEDSSVLTKSEDAVESAINMTADVISEMTLAVTALGILMTAITLLAAVVNIIASHKINEVDIKLDDIEVIEDSIKETKHYLEETKYKSMLLEGLKYELYGKYDHAMHVYSLIKDSIDEKKYSAIAIQTLYEIGSIYVDIAYSTQPVNYKQINKAVLYLEQARDKIDSFSDIDCVVKGDIYCDLGNLYGINGKSLYEHNIEEAREFFNKAIKEQETAIQCFDSSIYYKNLSITCFLNGQYNDGIQYLKEYVLHVYDYRSCDDLIDVLFEADEKSMLGAKTENEIYDYVRKIYSVL